MWDETYAQQVNRRLTAAKFLLMLDQGNNATSVAHKTALESALLQFYFAFYSYLNEILFYYKKPSIENLHFNFYTFLSETEKNFKGIGEFSVLKNWCEDKGDVFRKLSFLPTTLLESSFRNVEESFGAKPLLASSSSDLIAASGGGVDSMSSEQNSQFSLDNKSDVKKLVDEFQLFVDFQREYQAEY